MSKQALTKMWASLGIEFYVQAVESESPEAALISFIQSQEFPEDKKMMGLVLLWLKHFSDIVHIERLKILSQSLEGFELAVLGGLSEKCIAQGDIRWKAIITDVIKRLGKAPTFKERDSKNFIAVKGIDEEFQKFGLSFAKLHPDDDKKITTREKLVKKNAWVKNRLLFGANVRSDIATIKELGLAETAYGAAKIANCSNNAAYRNWNDLEIAGWQDLV